MRPDEILRRNDGASGPFRHPPRKQKTSSWGWASILIISVIAATGLAVILLG